MTSLTDIDFADRHHFTAGFRSGWSAAKSAST
jgi:hypothetical protein